MLARVSDAINPVDDTISTNPLSIDEEAFFISGSSCIANFAGSKLSQIILGEEHE